MNAENQPEGNYLSLRWQNRDPFFIEASMVRRGGYIQHAGRRHGHGIAYHYMQLIKALWPWFEWHRWSKLLITSYAENGDTGVMGPASSGKTFCSAAFALATFYVWPKGTSIVISTTTREALQLRIWGAIKELNHKARERRPYLPGRIIESRYMLTGSDDDAENKDFRDGVIGVACRVGGQFIGISNYVGLKNERVMLIADEASLMDRTFLDAISNLRKNPVFRSIIMGNPKDRTDALGVACEPKGGWDSHSQEEKTSSWKTRWGGIAIQLCGSDSPNYDYPRGLNPYRGLIRPEDIERDLEYYGRDSLQFSMMNLGIMPRDGGVRRVITRSLCESNMAMEEAIWADNSQLVDYLGLDAAYSGVGGDRCALTHIRIGPTVSMGVCVSLVGKILVPVKAGVGEAQAEEQIAEFCRLYAMQHNIPPGRFGLDSTGRGTLVSALARTWSNSVHAVEFGGQPSTERMVRIGSTQTEAEAYGKMVTALWFASRLLIESKQMRQLSLEYVEDGSFREWGVTKSGKIDIEPKEKTKIRMGRSPDLWDSLVVAIEVARRNGFQIAAGKSWTPQKRGLPGWMIKMRDKNRELEKSHALVSS